MNEPWLPFLATEFLAERILPRWRCFEWGSGGSTRWLAERCQHVVTVEHDVCWLRASYPQNAELLFREPEMGEIGPDPSDPAHYRSASTELGPGHHWRRYAQAIDGYGAFDLVLVDGRARASCIHHAAPHVAPGGWLVVDNTGDRPWYLSKTVYLFEGWDRAAFHGRGPLLSYPWECTLFRRPA